MSAHNPISSPENTTGHQVLYSKGLVKRYKKRTVVDEVSIQVSQGEIVGLLGPNGAGKTTTFYMMVGLVSPNEGEIYLGDTRIDTMPAHKIATLGVGRSFQLTRVLDELSVTENL